MVKKILIGFLFFGFCCGSLYAQESRIIDASGLRGEELVCIANGSQDQNIIFIGTAAGLCKKDLAKDGAWTLVSGLPSDKYRVNQILFDRQTGKNLIATDKGLFELASDGQNMKNIFSHSDVYERNCLSVAALVDGTILIGTQAGLFFKRKKELSWQKVSSFFDRKPILFLRAGRDAAYAAVSEGVYKTKDSAKRWEKIFNVSDYKENGDSDIAVDGEEAENAPYGLKFMAFDEEVSGAIYIAVNNGIFITVDAGKKWTALASSGLNSSDAKFIIFEPKKKRLVAVLKTGFFEYESDGWKLRAMVFDGQQAIFYQNSVILITRHDIFQYFFDSEKMQSSAPVADENILKQFDSEPTVQEVQKMAIAYCEVSDKKIADWRRRARLKAFMPEVSLDYDKTVTSALGATYDRVQVGPMDWGVSLKWELGDLVYNTDETSIDSRSKLMVELRNDVLAEITRLYFERRKLQMELAQKNFFNEKELIDKKLRLMELSAMLDRLTGGHFTKVLKSPQ